MKKAIDSPYLSTSMGEGLNMWLDTFVDLNDWSFEMAMAPHKFVPRLISLASSIPNTVLHSSLSPTSCLSPDGAEGDTAVDSNPISKDKTEGEDARNSKLVAEFRRKIQFHRGDCLGDGMISIASRNLPDQGSLITYTHPPHTRSNIGGFDWHAIRRHSHHIPSLGKL